MKINDTQVTLENLEATPLAHDSIILNKERFVQILSEISISGNLEFLKNKIKKLKNILIYPKNDEEGILNIDANGDTISLKRDVLISELEQISEAQTLERS